MSVEDQGDGLWPMARWESAMADPERLWEEVEQRLLMGETLPDIAKARGFPKLRFKAWVLEDAERAGKYLRFRADCLVEEALEVSHTPQDGEVVTEKGDGTVEVKRGDMLGHRKLVVETNLRLAGKWDRERYGDRTDVNVSVTQISITAALEEAAERVIEADRVDDRTEPQEAGAMEPESVHGMI